MERQCYVNSGACPAGELAGCSHPSSLRGGAGDRHGTVRLAPNLFVFPLSLAFRAGCDRLWVLSCWPPPPQEDGRKEESPPAPTAASLSDFKGSPSIVCAGGQWP